MILELYFEGDTTESSTFLPTPSSTLMISYIMTQAMITPMYVICCAFSLILSFMQGNFWNWDN